MGFTAIVTQVMLIREFLIAFYGNELSIGIILANWFILEATGSWLVGRVADRVKRRVEGFVLLQMATSLLLPTAVYAARTIKNTLGIPPGTVVGILPIIYCSFLVLGVLGLSAGAQFAFGCRMLSDISKKQAPAIGRVYMYEAMGSIVGGVAFAYLFVPHLHSIETALSVAALNLFSSVLLAWQVGDDSRRLKRKGARDDLGIPQPSPFAIAPALLLALTLYTLFSHRADDIHFRSIQTQWGNYKLRDYRNSIYGNVAVAQTEDQLTFFSSGIPVITVPVPDIFFVEEFVHLPLLFHPSPKKILLIGGGAGGILNEILKHPVERIDYAELDPLIIKMVEKFITPLTEKELTEPRVNVRYIDGRFLIRRSHRLYDIVIINLPSPSTLQLNRFYTVEFFRMVHRILRRDGILVVTSSGSPTYMSQELTELNACIYKTLRQTFPHLRVIPGDFNLFLASPSDGISSVDTDTLIRRFKERSLETELLTDFHIRYKLDQRRLNWFLQSLNEASQVEINRDFLPWGLFYSLSFWNSLFSPKFSATFRSIARTNLSTLLIPLGFLFFIFLAIRMYLGKWRRTPIPIAVFTTGFGGIAFNMVLILAFQSLYGYLYHMIVLLTTSFMVGLSLGSLMMTHVIGKVERARSLLLKTESIIVSFSALLPIVLLAFHAQIDRPFLLSSVRIILLIMNLISGFLVGSEFPVATGAYLSTQTPDKGEEKAGRVSGLLYGADLIGACLGAIAVSVVLFPVLGIFKTCMLVFALKVASLISVVTMPSN